MSMIVGLAGLAISAGSSIFGYFNRKKAEAAMRENARENLKFNNDYIADVYDQRVDEAGIYQDQAEGQLSMQEAYQGSSGASNTSGSPLLSQVQSQLNAQSDYINLYEGAKKERDYGKRQADLQYDAAIDSADALGSEASASLLSGASNLYSGAVSSGLIGTGSGLSMGEVLGEKALNFTSFSNAFKGGKYENVVNNVTSNPFVSAAASRFGLKGW